MSTAPRVSVVMPVFNRAWCVAEAVESVFATSEPSLELVVVDDGSTDDTPAILARCAAREPRRMRVVAHPGRANRGIARSRNLGVAESRGRSIAFLDSDDLYLPGRFAHALDWLDAHPDADACIEPFLLEPAPGQPPQCVPHLTALPRDDHGWLKAMLFATTYWNMPSITLRRAAFDRFGRFDERLPLAEEVALWLKLAAAGVVGAAGTGGPVALVRRHGQNSWSAVPRAVERQVYLHVLYDVRHWLAARPAAPTARRLVDARVRLSLVEALLDTSLPRRRRARLWLQGLVRAPAEAASRPVAANALRMLLGLRLWAGGDAPRNESGIG